MSFDYDKKLKITGNSIDECKEKLFKTFGKDFRIVDKQIVQKSGFLGFGRRDVTEVTYVTFHPNAYSPDSKSYDDDAEAQRLAKNREGILQNQSSVLMSAQISQLNQQFNAKIDEFEKVMSNKLQTIAGGQEKHESIVKIEDLLSQNEFTFSYIKMMEERIRNEFSLEGLEDYDLVERRVVDWIGESISVAKESVFRPPHVYIIVGPTGVGKTTTLVKLAAMFIKSFSVENSGRRPEVCFITTDSMRVGALEQLERWGDRLSSRVLKAERVEDLKTLYDENRNNVDAIFIDTSGYSPNDAAHLAQIKMLLDVPGMNPDVYLALTASTKARDLQNIMQNYEPFGYKSVIVTKCDESEQIGNVISVLNERHKTISYLTHGQMAARDITKANVVEFLKRLEGFKIDRVHIENKFGVEM
ncbi:MAG: hypothetical protein K5681_04750 [Treponema sp.]|nr:hypothetical protein [Treponema sp.]